MIIYQIRKIKKYFINSQLYHELNITSIILYKLFMSIFIILILDAIL